MCRYLQELRMPANAPAVQHGDSCLTLPRTLTLAREMASSARFLPVTLTRGGAAARCPDIQCCCNFSRFGTRTCPAVHHGRLVCQLSRSLASLAKRRVSVTGKKKNAFASPPCWSAKTAVGKRDLESELSRLSQDSARRALVRSGLTSHSGSRAQGVDACA